MKISTFCLVGALGVAALSGAAHASIVELKMTTSINGTTHTTVHPYMAPGDTAMLTVRYDTEAGSPEAFGGGTLYKNAVTYFGFALERGGVETYSGSVSGNFGQIQVANGGAYDNMAFRIFDDQVNYPSGTRNGTIPAGDITPFLDTGDPVYGDLFFRDFRMHFTMVDNTVIDSEALPTAADLVVAGGGSPFGPRIGNTAWSGFWEFENRLQVLGGLGSFGPGAPRDGDDYQIDFSVREYTGDSVSEVPLPAALPLFGFGLAGLGAALRRRKTKA
ncbi:VPLPA-CTERM sorting domain-containing protein [Hyphococcus luteus]|uniref:VPLPA-CTERM sorting domain-containing protein n=1 Tax=Hyphococcus luteus TaxID=2058213 RepID=UPI0010573999|nr:VPLPA-CTERM sorting domain-containing protein [Marinicaulis flavus]